MQLIIQKYLIRGNLKYDSSKDIMMSRLDKSHGSVIESELFEEYNLIFLFHEKGINVFELVQFTRIFYFDIRQLYIYDRFFNKVKRQRINPNNYVITLQDTKKKYAYTFMFTL